jgi:predicted ATP-grasp superfamily ATP-dependent carboligase
MELLERGADVSLFTLHAEACAGRLPGRVALTPRRVQGKAIVFARRDVIPLGTSRWLADSSMADVPHSGERIARGRPICTVFADGRDARHCLRALEVKAGAVYRAVEPAARGAA